MWKTKGKLNGQLVPRKWSKIVNERDVRYFVNWKMLISPKTSNAGFTKPVLEGFFKCGTILNV